MAFTSKIESVIIHSADLALGGWLAVDEKPQLSSDGWDSLTITYYRIVSAVSVEQAAAAFPIGHKLAARRWWMSSFVGPTCVAGGIYKLEVNYKGLAANQPIVVSYGSAAEQQSAENINILGGVFNKVSIHENTPTATARYILEDLTLAPTNQVGKASTPPSEPAVANTIWASIPDPTYHYPNGWVLMGSNTTPLPGTSVGLVEDSYKFIRPYTP